ncbi:hypothetical protein EG68_00829 [Paragonimus skrjabini miyazakii]|uniref:Uncharacterized protein n=1 Tax=Paragonimus skrjabini miyazakii TaxID=59628 RepID=A0A8S9Z8F9_9TREM|nr:hypothetical protein EG68_00829 [Paragonimus skrjabini miyazakii]
MSGMDDNEPHAEVVFMGGARVGKTTLVHRILQIPTSAALEGKYKPTIEDSFVRQFLVGDSSCRLRLVDTSGSYAFPAMQRLWVKRASAIILVCSRDDPNSLEHIRGVIDRIQEERRNDFRHLLLVLVVNKCDLHMKDWAVSDEEIEMLADKYEIPYNSIVFASAYTEMGVTQMMRTLWKQNEESGTYKIHFDSRSKIPQPNRRFSAFAVLFRNSQTNKPETTKSNGQHSGRAHTGSFSDSLLPGTRRLQSASSGSPGWWVKTFKKNKNDTKFKFDSPPTVIEMNCTIS